MSLFCVQGVDCFGNPAGYGGGPVAWYAVSLIAAALLVCSSLVKPWGDKIDKNDHIFVFIEAIKIAALFFLILTPEQLAGFQCQCPASLGQVVGQLCIPSSNVASFGMQCDPEWYAGAGYNLSATQLTDLASVCNVPDFLLGYFIILAAEIATMAYLFIVHECIFPPVGMRYSYVVFIGHMCVVGINCVVWGIYELFIYLSYPNGFCKLPLAGNGIALRAFCSLYMFFFSLMVVVLIHRLRIRNNPVSPLLHKRRRRRTQAASS